MYIIIVNIFNRNHLLHLKNCRMEHKAKEPYKINKNILPFVAKLKPTI